jgi:hypothetical protein
MIYSNPTSRFESFKVKHIKKFIFRFALISSTIPGLMPFYTMHGTAFADTRENAYTGSVYKGSAYTAGASKKQFRFHSQQNTTRNGYSVIYPNVYTTNSQKNSLDSSKIGNSGSRISLNNQTSGKLNHKIRVQPTRLDKNFPFNAHDVTVPSVTKVLYSQNKKYGEWRGTIAGNGSSALYLILNDNRERKVVKKLIGYIRLPTGSTPFFFSAKVPEHKDWKWDIIVKRVKIVG